MTAVTITRPTGAAVWPGARDWLTEAALRRLCSVAHYHGAIDGLEDGVTIAVGHHIYRCRGQAEADCRWLDTVFDELSVRIGVDLGAGTLRCPAETGAGGCPAPADSAQVVIDGRPRRVSRAA